MIVLANAAGKAATIINSRHCVTGYDQRLEAFGNRGSVTADNVRPTTVHVNTAGASDAQDLYLDFFLDRYVDAYARELDSFLAAVADGTPLSPSVRDGFEALRIADAAAESARSGQLVQL